MRIRDYDGRAKASLSCRGRAARSTFQRQTHLRILAAHSPELCLVASRPLKEGAGKTGCRPGTHGPLCERWQQKSAQRHTGEAQHTAFPAQWFYGLCRALLGERCTIAPVALRIADARARSGRRITTRLDAQTAGARTTRFCRTPITPVVCASCLAHGCPPCKTLSRRCNQRPPPPGPRS